MEADARVIQLKEDLNEVRMNASTSTTVRNPAWIQGVYSRQCKTPIERTF